jgi:hypothetical protein
MKRLPLLLGLLGAAWMALAIQIVAVRAVFLTNYIGYRTAVMLPQIGREIPLWQDVWIFNSWLVLTSAIEWALVGFVIQFAIRKLSR